MSQETPVIQLPNHSECPACKNVTLPKFTPSTTAVACQHCRMIVNADGAIQGFLPAKLGPPVFPMMDYRRDMVEVIGESTCVPLPDPTPEMLNAPLFQAVWEVIKKWDIGVPSAYAGHTGAQGSHVRAILDAVLPVLRQQKKYANLEEVRATLQAAREESNRNLEAKREIEAKYRNLVMVLKDLLPEVTHRSIPASLSPTDHP